MHVIAVFLGGGLGSVFRYGIAYWFNPASNDFPWKTLLANLLATLILGLASIFFAKRAELLPTTQLAVMTGFCGGFSTFSTFSLEMFNLLRAEKWGLAGVYLLASVGGCLAVLYVLWRLFLAVGQ